MAKPIPYEEMTDTQRLRSFWHDFCDADPVPPTFAEDMEASGFVTLRSVRKRDVESDPFAAERGIEIGGSMWVLTPAGLAAFEEEGQ